MAEQRQRSLNLHGTDAKLLDEARENLQGAFGGIEVTYTAVVRYGLELILQGARKNESIVN